MLRKIKLALCLTCNITDLCSTRCSFKLFSHIYELFIHQ